MEAEKNGTISSSFACEAIKKGKVLNTIKVDTENLVEIDGNFIRKISMHTVRYKSKTYIISTTLPNKKGTSFVIENLCEYVN